MTTEAILIILTLSASTIVFAYSILNRDLLRSNALNGQQTLQELIESARKEGIVLMKNGSTPVAVLLNINEFSSIQAMLELTGSAESLKTLYDIQDDLDKLENTEHLARLV